MVQTTWNQHMVKQKNKQIVLGSILSFSPLSRADIAQRTGLNKATVSSLVNDLLSEELIYESGPGESSGGRRPVMLLFNEKAGYSIGLDIGVNYLLGVVTDLAGNVVFEHDKKVENTSFDRLIALIKETIHLLIAHAPVSRYGVVGIGIGVPGIVDKSGHVLLAPNLGWKNVNLPAILGDKFPYPILVENEANVGAYGEKKFGAGQDHSHVLYVSVGIGIGVGIILKEALYRGINGYSGESGHMTIVAGGIPCTCGSTGCWEAYASEFALLKEAQKKETFAHASLEELIDFANGGDPEAVQLFRNIGDYIGVGLANLIKTFNPQQVIVGNRLANARHLLETPIRDSISKQVLPFHLSNLAIDFSHLDTHSAALGAAAFAIEAFLEVNYELL